MIIFLNIGSLILGLLAWTFPIVLLISQREVSLRKRTYFFVMSLSACSVALYFQLVNISYLVHIEDWTAIMDTVGGVVVVSGVLLISTILLNVITLVVLGRTSNK
ncbi:cytochrome c oxidase subunit 4 [Natronobacillus azotifigens]|uniref:Cytochrome c oxidase subunit 4 n=1 Tax=Natronobacillus azotifigens TaxID=472978 RepID=A0A9J6REQ8_9BACI|nr:hypothetical protein [Natronobacillus azotifigens]MCZ0703852.1 hypothetical protein [Natronobacillus azotifigens]